MELIKMLYDEIQDAVDRKVPFIIPIGTLEYHARHAPCGTDTLVDLSRCDRNTEWFAQSAVEASCETGKHMVECTLEWLREAIQ